MSISRLYNPDAKADILIVCEHASNYIPTVYDNLGLDSEVLNLHVAWDIGALELAKRLSDKLESRLLYATVSRLVYDLNRPPQSADAMPEQSEIFQIPGNKNLTDEEKQVRVKACYKPFHKALAKELEEARTLITIHSFTPVYKGQKRQTDIGILHDADDRLADQMLKQAEVCKDYIIKRNEPYSVEDGVTHTLAKHAIPKGKPNVMIEVRNDLIVSQEGQDKICTMLCGWLESALAKLLAEEVNS